MRRPAVIAVGTLTLIAAVLLVTADFAFLQHWFAIHTGTLNESGPYYGFWSGFGSDLGELTLVAAIGTGTWSIARKHNCEVRGCWRVGKHSTAAGHQVCRKHHPDDHLTADQVLAAHRSAMQKPQAAPGRQPAGE